jgi:hypothetical protein
MKKRFLEGDKDSKMMQKLKELHPDDYEKI